jgi:hypothetical protein
MRTTSLEERSGRGGEGHHYSGEVGPRRRQRNGSVAGMASPSSACAMAQAAFTSPM